jgi:hypothetical protein
MLWLSLTEGYWPKMRASLNLTELRSPMGSSQQKSKQNKEKQIKEESKH